MYRVINDNLHKCEYCKQDINDKVYYQYRLNSNMYLHVDCAKLFIHNWQSAISELELIKHDNSIDLFARLCYMKVIKI